MLSTGRTGTDTLHHLIALSNSVVSRHEPRPQLRLARKQAFESLKPEAKEFQKIFKRARGYELLASKRQKKVYVETSARMTFLAPAIRVVLPAAKFIYMFRHPAEIVRSGMRRGWYAGHPADPFRITPKPTDPIFDTWEIMSPFEKICWYWSAYNRFALDFIATVDRNDCLLLDSENLFGNDAKIVMHLFEFIGLNLPPSKLVAQVMKEKINAQTENSFPRFHEWSDEQKATLLRLAEPEIVALGYRESFAN